LTSYQISTDQQRQSRELTFKAEMIGLVSIVGFLFSLGLVLGPLAIVIARRALKINPEANGAFGAIVMGVIGIVASIAVPLSMFVSNI
jgi:uncharacterized Tic20 family protein